MTCTTQPTFYSGDPFSYSGRVTSTVDPQTWLGVSDIATHTAEPQYIADLDFEWLAPSVDKGDGTFSRLMRVFFDGDTSAWSSPTGRLIFDIRFTEADGTPIKTTGKGVVPVEQPVTQF